MCPIVRISLLLVLLSGCAGTPPAPPRWSDPATDTALRELLCRLDAECRWLRVRLYDLDTPLAEIRYRFEIVITRGLIARTADDSERAFLLAHELAHLRLAHQPPRSPAERLPQELEADAWATRKLAETGLDPQAGRRLLQRLRDELAATQPAPAHAAGALSEYAARIDALRDSGG